MRWFLRQGQRAFIPLLRGSVVWFWTEEKRREGIYAYDHRDRLSTDELDYWTGLDWNRIGLESITLWRLLPGAVALFTCHIAIITINTEDLYIGVSIDETQHNTAISEQCSVVEDETGWGRVIRVAELVAPAACIATRRDARDAFWLGNVKDHIHTAQAHATLELTSVVPAWWLRQGVTVGDSCVLLRRAASKAASLFLVSHQLMWEAKTAACVV
ncbi:hypothetical protein B0T17DRAFT_218041 [Bombardia bombarda]|uniref:Uncharacterized protein n=1 Tax=Bombardia bombarda TaxID=252184 RepID=A0AA39XAE7_9PEZI|nr:hypothetical protein B0T17DRAFT_218041 [Bombardia bombarda]